jgi:hypothetical protein
LYSGLYSAWTHQMADIEHQIEKDEGTYQPYDYYKDKKEGLQPFTMEHLIGAFYIYFILNGVAFLIVIIENIYYNRQ